MMNPPKSKNLAAMYDDLKQWETRIYKREQRTGQSYPAHFKLPGLNQMIPGDFKEEFVRKFAFEAADCDSMVIALKSNAQQKKYQKFSLSAEKAMTKDPNAMDLDSAEWSRRSIRRSPTASTTTATSTMSPSTIPAMSRSTP